MIKNKLFESSAHIWPRPSSSTIFVLRVIKQQHNSFKRTYNQDNTTFQSCKSGRFQKSNPKHTGGLWNDSLDLGAMCFVIFLKFTKINIFFKICSFWPFVGNLKFLEICRYSDFIQKSCFLLLIEILKFSWILLFFSYF